VSRGDFDPQPPLDPVRASLRIPPDALVIGCFGRLSREKGHVHLLHAFNTLAHHRPNVFLLVLGDGPEKEALAALRAALPCEDRIIFVPHRSNAAPFYEAIDILALPSLSEGLPNVVLEALAFGKPVVATAVGAVGAVVESGVTGFVVPPSDTEALGSALARLVDSPDLRRSFGEAARPSLYPRFCPTHRARRILGVYRALIPPVLNTALHVGLPSSSENHLYL